MAARKFADEEIRPISLARDAIATARETWDWDIIKKGSKLGFRTMAVPKQWGGQGTDFVSQALVMTELAKADSAISKAFSQNWKWSHLISSACTEEQKQRFLPAFVADDTFVLGKGITEPSAGSDNRMPGDDPKTGGAGCDTTGGDLFGDRELASNALGICDDACETALRYAKTAKQGGQVLFAQQNVQLQINKMFMLTEALRSYVMRVAWEHDMKMHSRNAGLAMNYSCDVVNEVTELYMEVRGANGCHMDHHTDKLVRDAFIWNHLAGDSVSRMKIARRLAA